MPVCVCGRSMCAYERGTHPKRLDARDVSTVQLCDVIMGHTQDFLKRKKSH